MLLSQRLLQTTGERLAKKKKGRAPQEWNIHTILLAPLVFPLQESRPRRSPIHRLSENRD